MKEVSEFEEELQLGPKVGLGFEGIEVGGINYGHKKTVQKLKILF